MSTNLQVGVPDAKLGSRQACRNVRVNLCVHQGTEGQRSISPRQSACASFQIKLCRSLVMMIGDMTLLGGDSLGSPPCPALLACGSTLGLILRSTLATLPTLVAAATMLAKSNSESMLTSTPIETASSSSQGSFPLPLRMHLRHGRERRVCTERVVSHVAMKCSG